VHTRVCKRMCMHVCLCVRLCTSAAGCCSVDPKVALSAPVTAQAGTLCSHLHLACTKTHMGCLAHNPGGAPRPAAYGSPSWIIQLLVCSVRHHCSGWGHAKRECPPAGPKQSAQTQMVRGGEILGAFPSQPGQRQRAAFDAVWRHCSPKKQAHRAITGGAGVGRVILYPLAGGWVSAPAGRLWLRWPVLNPKQRCQVLVMTRFPHIDTRLTLCVAIVAASGGDLPSSCMGMGALVP
jgi:hypothetical protein